MVGEGGGEIGNGSTGGKPGFHGNVLNWVVDTHRFISLFYYITYPPLCWGILARYFVECAFFNEKWWHFLSKQKRVYFIVVENIFFFPLRTLTCPHTHLQREAVWEDIQQNVTISFLSMLCFHVIFFSFFIFSNISLINNILHF